MALDQPIERLPTFFCVHDVQLVGGQKALDIVAKELVVAVTMKAHSKLIRIGTEEVNGYLDIFLLWNFEREHQVVAGGPVNKYQHIAYTAYCYCVTKAIIDINFVKIMVVSPVVALPHRDLEMVVYKSETLATL